MISPSLPKAVTRWSTRQVILATLVVATVVLSFWLLYQIRLVVYILFTAIIIGTALKPLTDWLARWNISPLFSVILIYTVAALILASFLVLVTPLLFEQAMAILTILPEYYHAFRTALLESPNLFLQQLSWRLPPELDLSRLSRLPADTEELGSIGYSLTMLTLSLKGLFITIATFMLSLYWTLDGERAVRTVLLIFPMPYRDAMRDLFSEMQNKVGGFVRGQAILCGVIGLMALIAYVLIGVPYAIVLAIFAGLMEAVPYLGPILGAAPALAMAASVDPGKAIWVLIATVIIQQLENNLFVPRIMKQSVGVNSFIALLAIFTFGSLLGVLGVVLAIPIAAVLQLLLDRFVLDPTLPEEQLENGRDNLSRLRYYVQDLIQDVQKLGRREDIDTDEEKLVEEDIEAIAADLDSILAQAEMPKVNL